MREAWPRRHCLKHALAPYRSGRRKTWLKTKCFTQSNFVVIGTDRDRKTGAVRALLAHNDGSGLYYAGAMVRNALGFSVSLSASPHRGPRLKVRGCTMLSGAIRNL